MAGNNLFGGLNSGDSTKYKKVGDAATKRERAEQLDARIAEFLKRKQDIEWAKAAISFVEEETRLNSDVFDISLNASRLKEIEEKANYIIEKKRSEDEAALKKRIDELDERIAALDKEPRSVEWAERTLKTLEKLENDYKGVPQSANTHGTIVRLKTEAEVIIEQDAEDKAAAKKAAEEEAKRQAAAKKAEEERLAAAKKAEAERAAKEKEEKRIADSAADIDKLIFDLSKASKGVYWCEDVKNAQNLVKNLELKIRSRCKNLAILDELAVIAKKVSAAHTIDEKILAFSDDFERGNADYNAVVKFEKTITDSVKPYLKEAETLNKLLKIAKDAIQAEEDRQKELRRQAAEKKAAEEKLQKEIIGYNKKLDAFIVSCQNRHAKYYETENFLASVPERVLPYLDKDKVKELKTESERYIKKQEALKQSAAEKEAKIDEVLPAFKADKKTNAGEVRTLYYSLTAAEKKLIPEEKMSALAAAYDEACSMLTQEIEREKKEREERLALEKREKQQAEIKRIKAYNRKKRLPVTLPILSAVLLLIVAIGVSFFVPNLRLPLVSAACVVAYGAMWFLLEWKVGNGGKNVAVLAVLHAVNPFLIIASIVFTAMGGEYACLAVAFDAAAFLAYLFGTIFSEEETVCSSSLMLGVSVVVTAIAVGLGFFEAGWTRGMVIGFPCLVAFVPLFVLVCIHKFENYNVEESDTVLLVFLHIIMVLGFGVMGIVGSVNFPGYMVILNAAALINAVLALISTAFLLDDTFDDLQTPVVVIGAIFLVVVFAIGIYQSIVHVKAYTQAAQIISILKQLIIKG